MRTMMRTLNNLNHAITNSHQEVSDEIVIMNIFKIITSQTTPNMKTYNDIHSLCMEAMRTYSKDNDPSIYAKAINQINIELTKLNNKIMKG